MQIGQNVVGGVAEGEPCQIIVSRAVNVCLTVLFAGFPAVACTGVTQERK